MRALRRKEGIMKESPAIRRWWGAKSLKGEIGASLLFAVALAVFVFLLNRTLGIGDGTVLIFVIVGWFSILKRIDDLRCEVEKAAVEHHSDDEFYKVIGEVNFMTIDAMRRMTGSEAYKRCGPTASELAALADAARVLKSNLRVN